MAALGMAYYGAKRFGGPARALPLDCRDLCAQKKIMVGRSIVLP